jgi:hypothetical protein
MVGVYVASHGGDHFVVVVELAQGHRPPWRLSWCDVLQWRVLLDAFDYGSWWGWSWWLSVVCYHRWMKMVVLRTNPSELRWGLKLHQAKALLGPASVGNVDPLRC